MRQRERLVIHKQHGVSLTTETIDDAASFAQRARELKATVPQDMEPIEARFLAVRCDGCGTSASVDFDDPRLPDGWAACGAGDFCPGCRSSLG
jgi:ribosomal protein S27E